MYQIENPIGKAMNGMSGAAGTYGSMMKDIPANRKPGSTVGGGVMAGMGGAAMGFQTGNLLGATAGTAGTAATAATATTAAAPAVAGTAGTAALGLGLGGWTGVGALLGIGAYLLS